MHTEVFKQTQREREIITQQLPAHTVNSNKRQLIALVYGKYDIRTGVQTVC